MLSEDDQSYREFHAIVQEMKQIEHINEHQLMDQSQWF